MIHPTQNKALHSLLAQLGWADKKADLVYGATRGRTSKSSEMSIEEADVLIGRLREEVKSQGAPMRKRIIHLMALMGYVQANGQPDYVRIDNFLATRTGLRNPKKKGLAHLTLKELHKCLQQVETIYRTTLKKLAHGNTGDHQHADRADDNSARTVQEGHSRSDQAPLESSDEAQEAGPARTDIPALH